MTKLVGARYLKALYFLTEDGNDDVRPGRIASRLGVSAASASAMVRRLAEVGAVDHTRYGSVGLTAAGRREALKMVRRQRLLETYLFARLDISLNRIHEEAERLERAISTELEDRIDQVLGHPVRDPHGHPIPSKNGLFDPPHLPSMAKCPPGHAVITRIPEADAGVVQYLDQLGLLPGTHVVVENHGPLGDIVWIKRQSERYGLGVTLAAQIEVEPAS